MIGRGTATGLAVILMGLCAPQAGAQIQFSEANAIAGITDTQETYGTAWSDLNGDGYPDIWLDKHQYLPTVIYLNQGNGTFVEYIEDFDEPWGLLDTLGWDGRMDTHGVGSADFDNDGDTDMIEITGASWDFPIWVNDGTGRFVNRFASLGFIYPYDKTICSSPECLPIGGRAPLWFDYDDDGNLDLMVAARYTPTYVYKQPTAMFRQNITANGSRKFVYDGSTGVNYQSLDDCDYGVLAELSGDDRLEVLCGSTTRIEKVWDTTSRPFVDLRPQLGPAVSTLLVSDLALGDFNGDLRTDIFTPRGSFAQTVAEMVGDRTVHALFKAGINAQGTISFLASGDLLVDFDWSTSVKEVFIGASAKTPPRTTDISVYNGWNSHVQLRLSPTDPANQGLGTGTAGGTYIGIVNGRWYIRFVTPNQSFGDPGIAVRADVSVSDLRSEGGIDIGQPANAQPAMLLQDAAHQLVLASSKINGPRSSCLSATPGDFDNDGDLDIYVGCTGSIKNLDNILYENDGLGNFTAITGAALGDARGDIYGRTDSVLTADYDLDGRLDLLVTNGNFPRPFSYSGRQQLFRNTSINNNHWVEIDLEGVTSNHDGIGARLFATTPDGKVQLREQGNGMHRYTQNHKRIHFGLAQNQRVDLEVRWPSGTVDHFTSLAADQIYALVEGSGATVTRTLSVADVTVDESAGVAAFRVQLAPAPAVGQQVDVTYRTTDGTAVAGSDYTAQSGGLRFLAGQSEQLVQVPVINDTLAEGAEQFTLTVSGVGVAAVTATATILASDLGVSGCGAPTYDPAVNAGLYLWEDNCGGATRQFTVRASAGGSATAVTYAGQVDSDQVLGTVSGFSLESNDVLTVLNGGSQVRYQMNVRQNYQDGFAFDVAAGAQVCFGADLPVGTNVLVGPNATPVATPFNLTTYGACGSTPPPPVDACGAPVYDSAVDSGLYLWEESCGGTTRDYVVRASAGGSASAITFAGQVDSSQAFTGVAGFSLESTDSLGTLNGGLGISYQMNVRQSYQDGFAFSAADGASVCFGMDLPAGTQVRVGPNATPVAAPFSLPGLGACAP